MKAIRHSTILQIIEEREIETQEELAAELARRGIIVTQATVSRDINQLGLTKIPAGNGRYRYAGRRQPVPGDLVRRARRAFREYVVDVDYTGHLILIKTSPGTAHAVAAAIDDLRWRPILGTVAGDDAILVIIREERDEAGGRPPGAVGEVLERFQRLRQ